MLTKNIDQMRKEVAAHIAADAVVQGIYWREASNEVGGWGCFIGCLAHSSDAETLEDRFGMPLPLVRIAERIFEVLPASEVREFFAAIPEAIGANGKDLSRVHWAFLADVLRHLPETAADVQSVIETTIEGLDLLAMGREWPAADAADAARAARAAADAAADAAYAAENRRQRDVFLKLLAEA